ncbi:MAG TPA: crotonase/enoyl-CoA hydratase family protein [Mycobacteriales bacterium]|nr:crotonase/enoyl-CoA hydratase family protein [Mycobacteriales bacterium]
MSEVLTEVQGNVLVITLNRPEARNAINEAVAAQLAAAVDRLDGDLDLRVGVITGAGGTFCSGMDLKGFLRGENPHVPGRGFAGFTQAPPKTPIIAAVEGWALAGGCEIVAACDLVVASREAKFGIPEVKRGLAAGAGGLLRLPQRIPYNIAMELALTGDPLTADQAHAHGLVNRLTEPGQALDVALALASTISANGPLAVAASKEIVRGSLDWTEAEGWANQPGLLGPVFASADAREGATAFAEKRPPKWSGT